MNTTLPVDSTSTVETHHNHPPHQPQHLPTQRRRLGFADRAALHLGIALIKWGRRPGAVFAKDERLATRLERGLARAAAAQRREAGREHTRLQYAQMLRMR